MNGPSRRGQELSPRERVRLALNHQATDRVPISLICAELEPPARQALADYLGVSVGEGIDRYLSQYVDMIAVGPSPRGLDPAYRGPQLHSSDDAYEDIWGVRWSAVSYGEGTHSRMSHYPLAEVTDISDLDKHPWPDADWWDYSALPDHIAHLTADREYALIMTSGNPFERTCWMRGFERSLFDMAEQPALLHAIMARVTDFYIDLTQRTLRAADGCIELAFTADDIGGQNGLLVSPAMWQEHIKPHHARLNRAIHELGARVVYHSDGSIMDAVPGLIEMGVDVLQALQFSAKGMDPVALKDDYGDRLCFQGGISVQTTLPFGAVEQVRQEVRDRIRVLADGGGYILSPSHTILGGTPPENVVAMFETAASTPLPG